MQAYSWKLWQQECYAYWTKKRRCICRIIFAKQIALAESGFIEPIIKVGNLNSLRTIADVRDGRCLLSY